MNNHIGRFQLTQLGQTCSQCRWRKVRCDKRSDGCLNCERLGLSCSSTVSVTDAHALQTSSKDGSSGTKILGKPPRLRTSRACAFCREKKIQCSGTMPTCNACEKRGVSCIYLAPKRSASSSDGRPRQIQGDDGRDSDQPNTTSAEDIQVLSSESPLSTASVASPPLSGEMPFGRSSSLTDDVMTCLIDAFFETIYPMPSYAFLHPPTTKRRCRSREHQSLVLALCAISALYLKCEYSQAAATWIQSAEQSIWLHLESPTIPRLQTLLLIIHHYMETGRFQRAFMLTANAARFATALRLNHERPDFDLVARETRRRIVWSLRIIERYFSVGLAEFELLSFEAIYIDFPCSEEEFVSEPPQLQESEDEGGGDLKGDEENGVYSFIIQLETVRQDIMKLTRSVAILDEPLPSLDELLRHHDHALTEIGSSIAGNNGPSWLVAENVTAICDRWLPRRMLMYISWHQAYCDLYRILLPNYAEAAPSVVLNGLAPAALVNAEQQCLSHATQIIHILTSLNQQSTYHHLLEFDTAICSYHAVRLILFISRFGRDSIRPSPDFAASRAELCLAALKRFFRQSILVSPIIHELEHSLGVFLQQRQAQSQREQVGIIRPSSESSSASTKQRGKGKYGGEEELQQNPPVQSSAESLLSATARTRQQLAIHSLLRQADFLDHELDDGENYTTEDTPLSSGISSASQPRSAMQAVRSTAPSHRAYPDVIARTAHSMEHPGSHIGGTMGSLDFYSVPTSDSASTVTSTAPQEEGETSSDVQYAFFSWHGTQDWDWLSSSPGTHVN